MTTRHANTPWTLAAFLFALTAATFLGFTWSRIAATSFEWGDFGANSVLIQQAKAFRLFHGNYSRVGFYHPGPAILNVLMCGEVVFHDWLKLTTPVGAQLIAVIAYSAAWIALIFVMLTRLLGNTLNGTLATAIFCGVTAHLEYQVFTGLWFPHLYYFPFAAFTVALSLAVQGETRFLPALAVAIGFLINGHVSFVAITAIMLAVGLAANGILAGTGVLRRAGNWWSLDFMRRNWRPMVLAVGLGALFLLPLVIDTIVHYPGQVPLYREFSQGSTGHPALESAVFVLSYLGPLKTVIPGLILLAGLVIAVRLRGNTVERRAPMALLAALAVATVATFVYAKVGVDDLTQVYVALYYYAVPALALAVAGVCVAGLLRGTPRVVLACAVILPALYAVQEGARKPLTYEEQFQAKVVPDLYAQVRALGPSLALDLDNSIDWGFVWLNITGVQAYASRRGEQPFCIGRNWHVVFTTAYRCSPEQLSSRRRLFVAKVSPATSGLDKVMEAQGFGFYETRAAPLEVGRVLRVADQALAFNAAILATGWSPAEKEFAWSNSPEATLTLQVPAEARRLKLDLGAFTPNGRAQRVSIDVEGEGASDVIFDGTAGRRWITLDLPAHHGDQIRVRLRMRNPISPVAAGVSLDPRVLGVSLYGVEVE